MDRFTPMLPTRLDAFSPSKEVKKLLTKAWHKKAFKAMQAGHLSTYDKLTSAITTAEIPAYLRGLLMNAYGHNIGEQVFDAISDPVSFYKDFRTTCVNAL